jgi:hypothetical protein
VEYATLTREQALKCRAFGGVIVGAETTNGAAEPAARAMTWAYSAAKILSAYSRAATGICGAIEGG